MQKGRVGVHVRHEQCRRVLRIGVCYFVFELSTSAELLVHANTWRTLTMAPKVPLRTTMANSWLAPELTFKR
jgi:hypothetical protein